MRGTISPANPWDVMVDLFFYREPEETKDEEAPEDVAYPGADYNANAALPAPGEAQDMGTLGPTHDETLQLLQMQH
jgi:hypothetical protein